MPHASAAHTTTGAHVQDDLFGGTAFEAAPAPRVLMALDPEYYDLIWAGEKFHEFRRRYLPDCPTQWFVWGTKSAGKLFAVIDLDPAIVDAPREIADIAERARTGNGASVFDYLRDRERGFAMPIRAVHEYTGFSADELTDMLGSWHPPQGYTLIDRHPALAQVCDKLVSTNPVRSMVVEHPSSLA